MDGGVFGRIELSERVDDAAGLVSGGGAVEIDELGMMVKDGELFTHKTLVG